MNQTNLVPTTVGSSEDERGNNTGHATLGGPNAALAGLLRRLPQAQPVGTASDVWVAPCPAHADGRLRLSLRNGENGRAQMYCHAGCPTAVVLGMLGLTPADLLPPWERAARPVAPWRPRPAEDRGQKTEDGGADQPEEGKRIGTKDNRSGLVPSYSSPAQAVRALEQQIGAPYDQQWFYDGPDGAPCGVIVRWDGPEGKVIHSITRRGGGWALAPMPTPQPLYRLTALREQPAARVYVTRGEPAADAGETLDLLTTTSPHGGSAAQADWSPLAGRDVVLLPDNDEAGHHYARDVAQLLLALHPPARVRIVTLPDLPPSGNFDDWVEAHEAVEADTLRAQLEQMAAAAPRVTTAHDGKTGAFVVTPSGVSYALTSTLQTGDSRRPRLQCLADIAPTPVNWLWPGRIPLGCLTLLVGKPGEGKSFLATDLAARVSTGSPWPDGQPGTPGSVLLITAENHPSYTVRPRLDAHGGDAQRIRLLSVVEGVGPDGRTYEELFTLADPASLEAALAELPDCRLVVVDPIGSFLGEQTDSYRDTDVRRVLAPVVRLAEKHGPAVLVVAHRRKSRGSSADDLALGSRAFTGLARTVWHLARDPHNKDRRLLLPGKNNLAPEGTGLAFTIGGSPATLHWESAPVPLTADDAVRQESEPVESRRTERREVIQWLRELLVAGPRAVPDVEVAAQAAGYPMSRVRRAAADLQVESTPARRGVHAVWSLPRAPTAPALCRTA